MSSFDWERFLKRWSQEIIGAIGDAPTFLPPEVLKSGWLGYPGATEKQIAHTEARLGATLPPSYRAFLKVSNGWRQTTLFSNQLWSLKDIEWFAVRHQAWVDAFWEKSGHHSPESTNAKALAPSIPDEEYFVYGQEQDCSKIRIEYLQTALEISKRGEGAIYLLNPQIVAPDGEWEAWFFGDWLPGADRYRSFQNMMQAEYENFLELRETPAISIAPALRAESDATKDRSIDTEPASLRADHAPEPSDSESTSSEPTPSQSNTSQPVAPMPSSATMPEITVTDEWHDLGSFTIECQTSQRQGHNEQRTIVHHRETDTVEIQSNIDFAATEQWMLQQLQASTHPSPAQETVGLEITQLRVICSPQTEKPMVVDQAQPLFSDPLHSGEPFALEVSMNIIGSAQPPLAEQQLVYRAQCIAHNLSTKLDTYLGDITTRLPGGHQLAYIAQFPEARLQQPGLYRLKVWVTLQNASASPSYFKVPMLQVV
ncbi:SMI1/KNR4 family protein [Stenomitos frigidus]|uniref:Knr4/Smi1-like domain-containing protein n=1 Tax=Stenomitos frigidus ULC18 TaxID=2107698 RepID=A0A2T1DUK7_9CYAN|nr:SMI1/KNR4 family protein [Stenomitos frigidus]PSB24196.1 hypothetical protein C7B82_27920 [Stenomitos frigidus ULC18]